MAITVNKNGEYAQRASDRQRGLRPHRVSRLAGGVVFHIEVLV